MTTLTAIGLMSPASVAGVDAAIITTDGQGVVEAGPSLHLPYSRDLKIWIRRAIKAAQEGRDGAADIGKAAGELTLAHVEAVEELLEQADLKRTGIDVIGFHGHTIFHRPAASREDQGRSWQIGDGSVLAEEAKIDVVTSFRTEDVAEGGQGAPLVPVYHQALAQSLDGDGPVGIITLGDDVSVTFAIREGRDAQVMAFDCGPGDELLDQWATLKSGKAMSPDGSLARDGQVRTEILRMMMLNPYLRRKPPKSLGQFDFKLDSLLELSASDGAATLTALSAACVRLSEKHLPEEPKQWVVCGPGAENPSMLEALKKALDAPVRLAGEAGWNSNFLDAECIGYLAVRSLKKLPLTYPQTTRAPRPIHGGLFFKAPI